MVAAALGAAGLGAEPTRSAGPTVLLAAGVRHLLYSGAPAGRRCWRAWRCSAPLVVAILPLLAGRARPAAPATAGGGRPASSSASAWTATRLPGSVPPPERTTREVMRRVAPELWAISGALSGVPYAFDRDPDGSYTDPDREARKALDDLPWDERVPLLRRGRRGPRRHRRGSCRRRTARRAS